MKRLIRNTTADGRCKYALVRLDKIREIEQPNPRIAEALEMLQNMGLLEYGEKGSEDEFFVLKLKDINTAGALDTYSMISRFTMPDEQIYSDEVQELAERSRKMGRKIPT